MGRRTWNDTKIKQLKKIYSITSNIKLAKMFNTTVKSIEGIAGRLKLKKTKRTRSDILKGTHATGKAPFYECNGVVYIYIPEHPSSDSRGYISKHRYIVEEKLHRQLKNTEAIIHKNGDKTDNSPENLEVKYFYKRDVSPIDVFKDRQSGMFINEIRKKYNISITTYYRKLKTGEKLSKESG